MQSSSKVVKNSKQKFKEWFVFAPNTSHIVSLQKGVKVVGDLGMLYDNNTGEYSASGITWDQTNIANVNMAGITLFDTSVKQATFRHVDWHNCYLYGIKRRTVNDTMQQTEWSDCWFRNLSMENMTGSQGIWDRVVWSQGTLELCHLPHSVWTHVNLGYTYTYHCMTDTNRYVLDRNSVSGKEYVGYMLPVSSTTSHNPRPLPADYIKVQTSEYNVRVNRVVMNNSVFTQCKLYRVQMALSDFTRSTFTGCVLLGNYNYTIKSCTFENVTWMRCTLENVIFLECSFQGAIFENCNLNSIQFRKCRFEGCRFTNTGIYEYHNASFHNNNQKRPVFIDCTFDVPFAIDSFQIYPKLLSHWFSPPVPEVTILEQERQKERQETDKMENEEKHTRRYLKDEKEEQLRLLELERKQFQAEDNLAQQVRRHNKKMQHIIYKTRPSLAQSHAAEKVQHVNLKRRRYPSLSDMDEAFVDSERERLARQHSRKESRFAMRFDAHEDVSRAVEGDDDEEEGDGMDPIARKRVSVSQWLSASDDNFVVKWRDTWYCFSREMFPVIPITNAVLYQCNSAETQNDPRRYLINTNMEYFSWHKVGIPLVATTLESMNILHTNAGPRQKFHLQDQHTQVLVIGKDAYFHEMTHQRVENWVTEDIDEYNDNPPIRYKIPDNHTALPSLKYYTEDLFEYMRAYLLGENVFKEGPIQIRTPDLITYTEPELVQSIADLDTLMLTFAVTSTNPIVLSRFIDWDAQRNPLQMGYNPTFVSTTTSNYGEGKSVLHLTLRPGVPFLLVKHVSMYPEENEVLLPRGLVYIYKGADQSENHNVEVSLMYPTQFSPGHNCNTFALATLRPVDVEKEENSMQPSTSMTGVSKHPLFQPSLSESRELQLMHAMTRGQTVYSRAHPIAIIVCGATGSGKTTLLTQLVQKYNLLREGGYVYCNFDVLNDDVHGTWNQSDITHNEMAMLAVQHKYNLVYDSTGRNRADFEKNLDMFHAWGYYTVVAIVHATLSECVSRAAVRTTHFVSEAQVRETYEQVRRNVPYYINDTNLKTKMDEFLLYDNQDKQRGRAVLVYDRAHLEACVPVDNFYGWQIRCNPRTIVTVSGSVLGKRNRTAVSIEDASKPAVVGGRHVSRRTKKRKIRRKWSRKQTRSRMSRSVKRRVF